MSPCRRWRSRVCEYGELTVPLGSDVVVMVRIGGAMVNVRLALRGLRGRTRIGHLEGKRSGAYGSGWCAADQPAGCVQTDAVGQRTGGQLPGVGAGSTDGCQGLRVRDSCVPLGSDAVVTVSVAGRMVRVRVALAVCTGRSRIRHLKGQRNRRHHRQRRSSADQPGGCVERQPCGQGTRGQLPGVGAGPAVAARVCE